MNELTKPPKEIHPMHFIMHVVSGLIIFCACVATDVAIVRVVGLDGSHKVQWDGGQVEEWNRQKPVYLTNAVGKIELGMLDDGTVVWRPRK